MECVASTTEVFLGKETVIAGAAMREVTRLVQKVAPTTATVLITGETGTGKEHVARAIHHYSLRNGRPWVDVNCGCLPDQLMESELFGYEKGAFSGASTTKPGLFELAHTGTIFLDEVGELDPRMQVKLLRVLDGAPYYRLGGLKKIEVDVRVVAATNFVLDDAVAAGKFRRDLYHRLAQLTIRVPPLRERREEIAPLAEYFVRVIKENYTIHADALRALESWKWPGNVRELRNAVTNAAVLSDSPEISCATLPADIRSGQNEALARRDGELQDIEKKAILDALVRVGGHHRRAAEILGISRRTLGRRLKNYRTEEVTPLWVH
jgi:DNA-binding NtrC family response regulator